MARAVGVLYIALGFLIGSRVITDNSFFTHFANGRLIWSTGIPRVDPYSFSAAGEPVTVQSWLASAIYSGLQQSLGDWTLRFFNGLLGAALAASLWRLSDQARQFFPRVLLVGATIVTGAGMWTPRPLLFGLLGFAVVLLVLRKDIPPWVLLPTMWIWVNSHGSFPIALVLIATVGAGQTIDTFLLRRSGHSIDPVGGAGASAGARQFVADLLPKDELRIFGWTTAGILLGAMNPLGWRLLWFPIHLLSRQEALEKVAEWQPPTFRRPPEWAFLLLVMIGVVVLVQVGRRRLDHDRMAEVGLFRLGLPALVFAGLGFSAYRNIPMACFLVVAFASTWWLAPRTSLDDQSRGLIPGAFAVLGVTLAAVSAAMTFTQGAVDLRKYPVLEVDWLEERALVANEEVNLVQRDTVGNYLEFRFGSQARVFMDDRFDFYPIEVLRDHDALIFGGDYGRVLDNNDADVVLWDSSGDFAEWLRRSDTWFVAYEEDPEERWLIACRVGSEAATRCQ